METFLPQVPGQFFSGANQFIREQYATDTGLVANDYYRNDDLRMSSTHQDQSQLMMTPFHQSQGHQNMMLSVGSHELDQFMSNTTGSAAE